MPFNPSGQFARNVAKTLKCTECGKPRILYASRKLPFQDQVDLDAAVSDMLYTCGMNLQDCIPALPPESVKEHIFQRVFVRKNMSCNTRIETPYFSSECFDIVCSHCGTSDSLLPQSENPDMYPLCTFCHADPTKKGILKRKRKLAVDSQV